MKTYAIKTSKGYLANQGDVRWFEERPVGWALFTTEEHANNTAAAYNESSSEPEAYEVEEVDYTPLN